MLEPDLRLLRYFVVLAEERHFARAAERLRIAQPALSQQVRRLEAQLGSELVDRSRRPVELTDAGRALMREGRLALSRGERAFAAARELRRGNRDYLNVGSMQAPLSSIAPRVFLEYHQRCPDVTLNVMEQQSSQQIEELLEDRLDVGFLRGPVDEPTIVTEPVLDDPLVLVVPSGHPLATASMVAVEALADEPVVLWSRSAAPTTFADAVELFRKHGLHPSIVSKPVHVTTVLALVAGGIGITLLPASIADVARAGTTRVKLEPPLPRRPILLAWRRDPSPTLAQFLSIARAVAADGSVSVGTGRRTLKAGQVRY